MMVHLSIMATFLVPKMAMGREASVVYISVLILHPCIWTCEGDLDKALKQKRAKGESIPEMVSMKQNYDHIIAITPVACLTSICYF